MDPKMEQRELLMHLAENLGGKVVFDPGIADVIVAPEPLRSVPEGTQVLIPTGDVLEAFYLFCPCRKHCFSV
jgi:hypothetical protein